MRGIRNIKIGPSFDDDIIADSLMEVLAVDHVYIQNVHVFCLCVLVSVDTAVESYPSKTLKFHHWGAAAEPNQFFIIQM